MHPPDEETIHCVILARRLSFPPASAPHGRPDRLMRPHRIKGSVKGGESCCAVEPAAKLKREEAAGEGAVKE